MRSQRLQPKRSRGTLVPASGGAAGPPKCMQSPPPSTRATRAIFNCRPAVQNSCAPPPCAASYAVRSERRCLPKFHDFRYPLTRIFLNASPLATCRSGSAGAGCAGCDPDPKELCKSDLPSPRTLGAGNGSRSGRSQAYSRPPPSFVMDRRGARCAQNAGSEIGRKKKRIPVHQLSIQLETTADVHQLSIQKRLRQPDP